MRFMVQGAVNSSVWLLEAEFIYLNLSTMLKYIF